MFAAAPAPIIMVLFRLDFGVMPLHGFRFNVLSAILIATTPAPESRIAIIYMLGAKLGNFSTVRMRAKIIEEPMAHTETMQTSRKDAYSQST